jgi:UDP-2,4-diacetamido-2,4,6-trideoxy-beta-L-altropyranose hydrolase
MKVVFRVDSSVMLGTGHLMRCLALAEALGKKGAESLFVCRDLDGNVAWLVERQGWRVSLLPDLDCGDDTAGAIGKEWEEDANATVALLDKIGGADWVVVDHYGLGSAWERRVRESSKHLLCDR